MIRPQKEFPLIDQFKIFPITDETIFAYKGDIYANHDLPQDILIHEEVHLDQQNNYGADDWIKRYLIDNEFRLKEEIEAFKTQVNFHKDREQRNKSRILCAKALSSQLYGNILTYSQAFNILK